MKLSARTAANMGLLTAVSIVLTRVFGVMVPIAGVGALRLSFGEIPIMLTGVLFGPLPGALTGIAADVVGYLINAHGGPYFPGFTLSSALVGFIPGMVLGRGQVKLTPFWVAAVVFFADVVTGILLNTLWVSILYGQGFFVLLPMRLLARLVTLPLYTITVYWAARAYQAYQNGRAA